MGRCATGALYCILKPGQSIKLPESANEWKVSAKTSASVISGIVIIGDGELTDNQIAGTVSVVNGELVRVKAGGAFIGLSYDGPTAGQYSHAQIWNPAASGKNVFLTKATAYTGAVSTVQIKSSTTAIGATSSVLSSKKLGAAGPSSELRSVSNAALLGTQIGSFTTNADARDIPFSEPILIPPGYGIITVPQVVNVMMWTTYQWIEEPF